MKIKKFKNLWLMGIIIFSAILVSLYVIKIVFPDFIIGVAEIDSVVKFGEYVDSHKWAYYLFNGFVSFLIGYVYCCACCRKPKLSIIQTLIVLIEVVILYIVLNFLPEYYSDIDTLFMLWLAVIFCKMDKRTDIKYFYSTITTLSIHCIAQMLSLEIRGIAINMSYPNSATFTILTIDLFIWLLFLKNFYNYREDR